MKLYSRQYDYHASAAPVRLFRAGRGSGKSIAGAADIVIRSQHIPGPYLAVAPTYRMAVDVLVPAIQQVAPSAKLSVSTMSIAIGPSTIKIRSCDNPDALRGLSVLGAWWDEAGMEKSPDTYRIILGCLRCEGAMGWLGITTTPRSHQWLRELSQSAHVIAASSFENPFVSMEFVEQMAQQYPADWRRQEIQGEFLDCLKMFKASHFRPGVPDPAIYRARGWDLARTQGSGDHLAGVLLQADARGRIAIMDEVRAQRSSSGVVQLIQDTAQSDGPGVTQVVEEEGGAGGALFVTLLRQTLEPMGLSVVPGPTKGGKVLRALPLAANADKWGILLPDKLWGPRLQQEFLNFDGSEGGIDDCVDAAAHAYQWLAQQRYGAQLEERDNPVANFRFF